VPLVGFTRVPQLIRKFGERYPRVELELHSLTVPEQMSALRDGRIHVGILRPPVEGADLVTEPLLSEPLVVAFPHRHRFATFRRVPWRALSEEPYIGFSPKRAPSYHSIVAQGCREAGIRLNVRHEADNPQTVLALVEAGIGVSLVPASFERVKHPGVAHRGLRPVGPSIKTIMAWRQDDEASPLVQAFLGVIRETTRGTRRDGATGRAAARPRPR
jgi:DNA-binding transcriptional LysR family regulator